MKTRESEPTLVFILLGWHAVFPLKVVWENVRCSFKFHEVPYFLFVVVCYDVWTGSEEEFFCFGLSRFPWVRRVRSCMFLRLLTWGFFAFLSLGLLPTASLGFIFRPFCCLSIVVYGSVFVRVDKKKNSLHSLLFFLILNLSVFLSFVLWGFCLNSSSFITPTSDTFLPP